jgi:quinol monooxygenase YgiN
MINKIAEFKVKAEKLEECRKAIAEFVEATKSEPGTLRYEAFVKEDGVSFVHFMQFKDEEAEKFHQKTPHVQKFVEVLYPNCEIEPRFTELKEVSNL